MVCIEKEYQALSPLHGRLSTCLLFLAPLGHHCDTLLALSNLT